MDLAMECETTSPEEEEPCEACNDQDQTQQPAECRICQLTGTEQELISPCSCSGTMQFVHLECLEAWRRRTAGDATKCGVCNARYNHIWTPPTGTAELLFALEVLRRARNVARPAFWGQGGPLQRWLTLLLESPSATATVLRLYLWTVLFCFGVIVGRILLLVILTVHEIVMGIDKVVDPYIFPPPAIDMLKQTFPSVGGFGNLGVFEAVSTVLASVPHGRAAAVQALLQLASTMQGLPHWMMVHLARWPESLGEGSLGVLVLLVTSYMLLEGSTAGPDQSFLARLASRIPSPIADGRALLRFLCPFPTMLPTLLVIVVPLEAYTTRWILDLLQLLPLSALPLDQHVAVHMWMALATCGIQLVVRDTSEAIREDFKSWYAALTADPANIQRSGEVQTTRARLGSALFAWAGRLFVVGCRLTFYGFFLVLACLPLVEILWGVDLFEEGNGELVVEAAEIPL